jgi:cytochrome P450
VDVLGDPDVLRDIRNHSHANGGVFWLNDRQLMVADGDVARRVHLENFADLTLPDRFVDQIRRRHSTPASWKQVRGAWLAQFRAFPEPESAEALATRMEALLRSRVGQPVNFVWLAHEVIFRSLLPLIIDGLSEQDRAWIARDAIAKLERLNNSGSAEIQSRSQRWHANAAELQAGFVVRKEIRGRATGRRPARMDLTQPIVDDLLATLGSDRALEAVTTVLTAVAGPPGATAGCVMFEFVNQPDWAERLTAELRSLAPGDLYRSGVRHAPITHRFVREVLRKWTAPLLLTRSVRCPMTLPGTALAVGQQYLVSPYLIHHHPRYWPDAESFDPDRWLPGAANGPVNSQYSVPFGWAPTSCIGAGIGMLQQVILCHLLCTRFRIKIFDQARMRIALAAMPLPLDFTGIIALR